MPPSASAPAGAPADAESGGAGPAAPAAPAAPQAEDEMVAPSTPPKGAPSATAAATLGSRGWLQPPACPTLALTRLELVGWYVKPPKGPLCCAVHVERKVVWWSAQVVASASPGATISFDLGGFEVRGDVRVSVLDLDDLLAERAKRTKQGASPQLPWDAAARGPWGDVNTVLAVGDKKSAKEEKRVIAGKETGCKFFMLFHTGFVKSDGVLPVPLQMMDKAFKNKKNKYNPDGVANLHFGFVAEEAGLAPPTPAPDEASSSGEHEHV